jgi:hypothetical protein
VKVSYSRCARRDRARSLRPLLATLGAQPLGALSAHKLLPHWAQNALPPSATAVPQFELYFASDRGSALWLGAVDGRAGAPTVLNCAGYDGEFGVPRVGSPVTWITFVICVFEPPRKKLTPAIIDPAIISGMPMGAPIIVIVNNNPIMARMKPKIRKAHLMVIPLFVVTSASSVAVGESPALPYPFDRCHPCAGDSKDPFPFEIR